MSDPLDDLAVSEKINDFFDSISTEQVCPICKNSEWYYYPAHKGSITPAYSHFAMISSYALFCTKCGFIRHHARAIVDGKNIAE